MITFWLMAAGMVIVAMLFINWSWLPVVQTKRANVNCQHAMLMCALSVLFIIAAIGLYLHWGSSQQLSAYYQSQKQAQLVQQEIKKIGSPQQVIAKLEERLQQQPDAKGWYLLGRLYFSQGQLKEAISAYDNAKQLQPSDPKILLAYTEALFLRDNALSQQAKQMLEHVLVKQPDNPEALNILAIAAYQQGDYQQAINVWEQLLVRFPANTEDGKKLLEAIAKAQAGLQQQVQHQANIKIPVRVTIANNVSKQVAPDDTVFIYVQAAHGPKMPLAILRKQVKDLPLNVTLDESMAMMPALKLSNFKEVRIVARISKSGQAAPQPGDWFAESAVFKVDKVPKNIVITIQRSW